MTPEDLQRRLADLAAARPSPPLPEGRPPEDPAWRDALEARAAAAPGDRALRALLLDVHALAEARAGLPPRVGGVQLGPVVRADGWSVTLLGHHTRRGSVALVRTLRAGLARDPLLRRQLARDGAALRAALPGLEVLDEDGALVLADLSPALVADGRGPTRDASALGALALRTIAGLRRREVAGAGLPEPGLHELRDDGDRLTLACLDPGPHAPHACLAAVATALVHLAPDPDDPLAVHLAGWTFAPPSSAEEAGRELTGWLAEHLAATRHGLARARVAGAERRRRDRLARAMAALDAAVPPPTGRGVVGLDLDGNVLIATCDGEAITWGVAGGRTTDLWDAEDGLDVPAARRLVRVRGSAPSNPRLDAEHGADPGFTDHLARWLSGALELRALRRLLDLADAG